MWVYSMESRYGIHADNETCSSTHNQMIMASLTVGP